MGAKRCVSAVGIADTFLTLHPLTEPPANTSSSSGSKGHSEIQLNDTFISNVLCYSLYFGLYLTIHSWFFSFNKFLSVLLNDVLLEGKTILLIQNTSAPVVST